VLVDTTQHVPSIAALSRRAARALLLLTPAPVVRPPAAYHALTQLNGKRAPIIRRPFRDTSQ
jgi:hypothetical protein